MAESGDSSGLLTQQVIYLFRLVLRLKQWKFLFWLVLLPIIFLNFYIYKDIEKVSDGDLVSNGVTELKLSSAMAHKVLIDNKKVEKTLLKIISNRKGSRKGWIEACGSLKNCKSKLLESLVSGSNSIYGLFNYAAPKFFCLNENKAPIMCPFLFHMMSQSKKSDPYKDVKFSKFNDVGKVGLSIGRGTLFNLTMPNSMCKRTLKSFTYFSKFFLGSMGHVILLAAAFILNFTVGTLSSISNLKENGFLQLVFNNGLSVSAYWIVYCTIASVESLLFTVLFYASYEMQCPGFYTSAQVLKILSLLFCFYLSVAALGLLFATLIQSFFIVLLLMILVTVLSSGMMVTIKLVLLDKENPKPGLMSTLLWFPPGHILELLNKYMLPESFNKMMFQKTMYKDYKDYFNSVDSMIIMTPFMLIFSTIYLDFIVKNGNGLCLPYSYPFNSNFWNPQNQMPIDMVDEQPKRANVEPTVGTPAVIANDIMMTYPADLFGPKRPPVLKGVTCTVYQGQITALIGHNGAGKTTLIRVLMGEEIPTSGAAIINGHRVTDPYQRLALRGSVSICKQVDVLSNYLTVMESMKLTLIAKGFSVESQLNKVLDMMKRLGLAGKENVQAMDLSGGQMRKVCSIICLLGNPRLVILDEPTSGLDPVSRRNLWQILKEHKAGRSIILCTQFMDEADILADRKMFLSAGKLICAGSSLFLKYAFGCCVSINVSLKSEKQTAQLMKLLKKVKLVSQSQTELILQVSAEKPKILAGAVKIMEQHPELVDAFGVSQAQLDDIFMRLKYIDMENIEASFKSKQLRKVGKTEAANVMADKVDFTALYKSENRKAITSTMGAQFSALMSINLKRQWKAKLKFLFRMLVPVLLILGLAMLGTNAQEQDNKAQAKGKKLTGKQNGKQNGKQTGKPEPETSDPMTASAMDKLSPKGYIPLNVFCIYDGQEWSEGDFQKNIKQPKGDADLNFCQETLVQKVWVMKKKPMNQFWIPKNAKTTLKAFVQKKHVKKLLRKTCPQSDPGFLFLCLILYTNSWNTTISTNEVRQLDIMFYENQPDSPEDSHKLNALYQSIDYYHMIDSAFGTSGDKSGNPFKLYANSTYMIKPYAKYSYMPFEIMAYTAAFALIPVTYLNDPIEDKDSGVRQHLTSIGLSSIAYWVNTFVQHWIHNAVCYLFLSLACLTVAKNQNSYFFGKLVLPNLLFGTTTSQLSVYVISATMKKTNAIILVIYFFVAMILGLVVCSFQDNDSLLVFLVLLLPPIVPVTLVIMGMKILDYSLKLLEVKNASDVPNLSNMFSASGIINLCMSMMPIHILLQIGLIYIIENPAVIKSMLSKPIAPPTTPPKPVKDEGVKIEANRINKSVKDAKNMLEVRNLQKVYPNGVHAVRGTTFGVLAGEIIGLLGPNGAGKTTSMSIIVGEEAPSSGTSEVNFSGSWMSGIDGARSGAIGYCPQHNPLFNQISVYDHLCFYAQIRGISDELSRAQIAGLIDGLGLKPHQEKAAEQLSGGNKRRLCLAIALLGNPSLVVIDEASTGVDPENKRFIWCAIRGMASKDRSVMITTHSMEEVEALCSRVGIMNKGLMIGFGTVQQLRSRHGEAYTLDVMMKAKETKNLDVKKKKLTRSILKQFPKSIVMEDLMRCMQFNIPRKSVNSFSDAMRWMISKKKTLGIQYFSMYQMSLDQVFVKLVKEYDQS